MHTILNGLGAARWEDCLKVLEKAKGEEWFRPNETLYSRVIAIMARAQQPDAAQKLYDEMTSYKVVPTALSRTALLSAYARVLQLDVAEGILEDMKSSPSRRTKPTTRTFTVLLDVLGEAGAYEEMTKRFQHMGGAGYVADTATYNVLIKWYGRGGLFRHMENAYKDMLEREWKPDSLTFQAMVEAYAQGGLVPEMEEAWERMKEERASPRVATCHAMAMAYAKNNDFQKAETMLERMVRQLAKVPSRVRTRVIDSFSKDAAIPQESSYGSPDFLPSSNRGTRYRRHLQRGSAVEERGSLFIVGDEDKAPEANTRENENEHEQATVANVTSGDVSEQLCTNSRPNGGSNHGCQQQQQVTVVEESDSRLDARQKKQGHILSMEERECEASVETGNLSDQVRTHTPPSVSDRAHRDRQMYTLYATGVEESDFLLVGARPASPEKATTTRAKEQDHTTSTFATVMMSGDLEQPPLRSSSPDRSGLTSGHHRQLQAMGAEESGLPLIDRRRDQQLDATRTEVEHGQMTSAGASASGEVSELLRTGSSAGSCGSQVGYRTYNGDNKLAQSREIVWSLVLIGYGRERQVQWAARVWKLMCSAGIRPDLTAYNSLMMAFVMRLSRKRMEAAYEEMREQAFAPDLVTYSILIEGYRRMGMRTKVDEVLQDMKNDERQVTIATSPPFLTVYSDQLSLFRSLREFFLPNCPEETQGQEDHAAFGALNMEHRERDRGRGSTFSGRENSNGYDNSASVGSGRPAEKEDSGWLTYTYAELMEKLRACTNLDGHSDQEQQPKQEKE
ncbi:hypothetical protein CBR_g10841 [Chara braunii]|uniref:Pentacotripeptide-repeat region of PRORP domain-containing protein n=1 Tax=Chara braunii TaxID=69332 RepID=A0A388KPE0_CHABU|nr:hypothetical protein CBR_g10841 [Chara braunii]|eukprot:GBG71905.1 hypothetical protein CBR_g10841 [Chara braunii]